MSMLEQNEIVDLLKAASAYDHRKPDRASVLAWGEAARRAGWDYAGAMEAVHGHYAESAERIMPGHVTQRLRQARRQPEDVQVQLPSGPGSSEEHRARVVQELAEELARRRSIP